MKISGFLVFAAAALVCGCNEKSTDAVGTGSTGHVTAPQATLPDSNNYFQKYLLKKGRRKYHKLVNVGDKPDASNEKLTDEMVLADTEAFKRLVETSLINGYLKEDGNATDDMIDLSELKSGVVYVSTNSKAEMEVVLARLKEIEDSVLVSENPDEEPAGSGPELKTGEFYVHFHPELVKERIEEFRKSEDLKSDQLKWSDVSSKCVYERLTEEQEARLLELYRTYDKEPWQVVLEVKLLSVSEDTEKLLSSKFGYSSTPSDKGPGFSVDGATGTFNVGVPIGSGELNATIQALESQGKAVRQKESSERYWETYRKDMPAYEFEKKDVTPIAVKTEHTTDTKDVKVGLGLKISRIQVVETPEYTARMKEFDRRYNAWVSSPETKSTMERINLFYQQGKFTEVKLEEIERILKKNDEFLEEYRFLLCNLNIALSGELQDGGVLRTFETPNGPIPQFEEITHQFNMLVGNKTPAFIGGTTTHELSDNQKGVTGLSKVPFLGKLFGQTEKINRHDSAVAFVTITVLDDVNEQYAAAKFTTMGQRFAIPRALGGFDTDSSSDHPMSTGIRSDLFFMYGGDGVFYRASRKIAIVNEFAMKLFGQMFYNKILLPISQSGVHAEEDWLNYSFIREQIDHLPQPKGVSSGHPFINRMRQFQQEVKTISGTDFSLSELLALARHNHRLGRGSDPSVADERLTLYMAYLIARETGEKDIFRTQADLDEFAKVLPGFKAPDGARRAADYNKKVVKRLTKG